MNTLSFSALSRKISRSKNIQSLVSAAKEREFPLEIEGSEGAFTSLVLASLYQTIGGQFFVVVPSESDAEELANDLAASGIQISKFPWWGTAVYRGLNPFSAVFAQRIKVLSDLARGGEGIVIIPLRALLTPVPPPRYVKNNLIELKAGDEVDTSDLAKTLAAYGYVRVPLAQVHGEFALRGEVLDIFMGAGDAAVRVLFDFNRIESIKQFDPAFQNTSKEKLSHVIIYPNKEVIWTDERIETLKKNLSAFEEFENGGADIIDQLVTRGSAVGEELFYPLSFAKAGNILDYGSSLTLILLQSERLANAQDALSREYHGLYERAKRESNASYPLPERILLDYQSLIGKENKRVFFKTIKEERKSGARHIELSCEPARSFFGNMDYLNKEFGSLLDNGWQIAVAAESEVQAERVKKILPSSESLFIMSTPLSAGFALPDINFMLVQENEIFGRRKRPPRSLVTARSRAIDTFVELNPGDYVVHANHGIGLFKGIQRLKALGHERDYIHLEYADEEMVFVPVEQVNLVQRYIGNQGQNPRLDILGSKSWENRKNRVKKSVLDIAEKLIELYSKRKRSRGFAFPADTEWQTMFEAAFPFEETDDQIKCVQEIKLDMESASPMDRLVCGDVGFGKTEVALRACFKAVMSGRQVAFLAPTTILAEQHYENFIERFSRFPVNIAMLSRFVSVKKARVILQRLKNGEIDLLVGTHRIIQKDIHFKNLGLLVIDEEQRFGVKDKERLKELKTNVDCLCLSATPIPRTLHMSLVKIRDMSLLTSAPRGRLPIETFVEEYDEKKIAQAIRREIERGGQVFFLHNRVETLRETRQKLEKLLPEALMETAHGQMEGHALEDVMRRFIHGGFHVLVSTTIIENGIDIPNVNTIIIDRADMYGVSQLYQLRGRVGRSDRVAYAYLFYPKEKSLSELAMKRLQTVSDFTELGSGFKIAMKDMEIRGAGNLLGREQSGDIYSVGFDLYVKLLEDAVKKLEDADYEPETETLLELEYSGFIPDSYIDSQQTKMEIYKMIASVMEREELERVYAELTDRFGPLPDAAASLLALAEIRIICRDLAVSSLKEKGGILNVEFAKVSKVNVERLIRLMRESSGKVTVDPKKPNVIKMATGDIGLREKSEFIREKLSVLMA